MRIPAMFAGITIAGLLAPAGASAAQPLADKQQMIFESAVAQAGAGNDRTWQERPFRLPDVDPQLLSPEQRAAAAETMEFLHLNQIVGPFRVWVRDPVVLKAMMRIIKTETESKFLGKKLNRLVGIVVSRQWGAQFEWFIQAPFAARDGLAPDIIDAIRLGKRPTFINKDEEIVFNVVEEFDKTKSISQARFDRARELLGDDGVAELVNNIGVFTMAAITIKGFEIKAPMPFAPNPLP